MPFIPHTQDDVSAMLRAIGAKGCNELFDEIPKDLISSSLDDIPQGISELELNKLVTKKARQIDNKLSFIGAGAYEHHIPAAVWEVTSRGEYLTAYTPYQAEASQGSLQLLYEFQTMITGLTGMDVANASMYDGASALAESVLMAVRCQKKKQANCVVLATTLHPFYRETVANIVGNQGIELIELEYDAKTGCCKSFGGAREHAENVAAVIVSQPNFFGVLEEVDDLTNWAHSIGAKVIGCVNPMSLALLTPPGEWGEAGADIVCGEGQPLGVPLASGGPYYGFLACKQALIRQLPGRLVGRTVDVDGKNGFTLTLQAREQHIRRSRATSNICTNQGLLVTASTVYMSMLGDKGLREVAKTSHLNTAYLMKNLEKIEGVSKQFSSPFFHEVVVKFTKDVNVIYQRLEEKGFSAGFKLQANFEALENCLLICVTETKSREEIDEFVQAVNESV